jgi:S1-C subfamily serine protease
MAHKRAGDMLELTVLRNGKSQTIKVHLGEAPQVL